MIKFSIYLNTSLRFDKYLSDLLHFSRNNIFQLFKDNKIKLNGKDVNKSVIAQKGDVVEIDISQNYHLPFLESDFSKLKVIFENQEFLFIYKPPLFHSANLKGSFYSVESYLSKVNSNYVLLNRLDFNTEGILIAAKSKEAFYRYRAFEKSDKIEKYYIAFVDGYLKKPLEIQSDFISKGVKRVKISSFGLGKHKTFINPIAFYNGGTLADIKIFRGARHQIRVHSASSGYPLMGDFLYNKNIDKAGSYFLFCYKYNIDGAIFDFTESSPLKSSFKKFLI